jgi:hypothetical protein
VASAKLIGIYETSVQRLPGFIKVVSKGNYLAVVCEREEQAINAARQLKVNWQKPSSALFPSSEDFFKYIVQWPDVIHLPSRARYGHLHLIEHAAACGVQCAQIGPAEGHVRNQIRGDRIEV